MAESHRIALFGGTFDPVHLGHLAMAKAAVEALNLDQVRFLPCQISPHKQNTTPTPADQRIKMLKLACEEHEWALIDDFETHTEGPSYSWMTAETMKAHFPDDQLYWIMGSDQWNSLDDWAKPERLAACVEFIVFHRGEELKEREGYTLHSLPAVHPANATDIRNGVASGTEDHPWLDAKVAAYMEQQNLYRQSAT